MEDRDDGSNDDKTNNGTMNVNAVITGDLVKSSKIIDADIAPVINSLKHTFNEINRFLLNGEGVFEIYRGDSFQGLISKIE